MAVEKNGSLGELSNDGFIHQKKRRSHRIKRSGLTCGILTQILTFAYAKQRTHFRLRFPIYTAHC